MDELLVFWCFKNLEGDYFTSMNIILGNAITDISWCTLLLFI